MVFAAHALALALTSLTAGSGSAAAAPRPEPLGHSIVVALGRSVDGRPVRAVRVGDRTSTRKALVVGEIHGDETAGRAVIHALRRMPLRGVDLWTVETVNPDGHAARRRQNAHGVDLNRNFPTGWLRLGPRGSQFYPGSRPRSEPETRLVQRLVTRLRPAVTIWYHQPFGYVVLPDRGRTAVQRRYAKLAGLPARRIGRRSGERRLAGTAIQWQNHTFPSATAFVVEFRGGPLSFAAVARHARAVVRVATGGAAG